MYDYTSTEAFNEEINTLVNLLGKALLVALIIFVAVVVLIIVAACKYYKKCGRKGWEAIVPFYNQWVLVEIAGLNWWWFLLLIASSLVAIFFEGVKAMESLAYLAVIFGSFACNFNIAKKYHKGTGFAILMTIFPVIVIPIIAFSKNYQFDDSVSVSKNAMF